VPADDPSMEIFNKILQHVTTSRTLVAHIRIDEKKYWNHELYHKTFGVSAVSGGTITKVVIGCAGYTRVLDFQADVEWTIPEKWNGCTTDFIGTPGTEFDIVEFRDRTKPEDVSPPVATRP
jgi:hypothetical protein